MAVTVTQSAAQAGNLFAGTSAYNLTDLTAVTAGDRIIVIVHTDGTRTVSSITDSGTTSYAAVTDAAQNNDSGRTYIYEGIAAGADAGNTITVNLSGNDGSTTMVGAIVCTGMAADTTGTVGNGAVFDAATAHNSGSVTPGAADNIIVATMNRTNGDWTEDAAFTNVTITGGDATKVIRYLIQASATASEYNATSADNEFSTMSIAAFSGASAGGTAVPVFMAHRRSQGLS